jgi:hypothetical protein
VHQDLAWRVLEQVAVGAGLDGADDVGVGVVGGEHQHPRRFRSGAQLPGGVDSVEAGHAQVHQDQVGPQLDDPGEGLVPVGSLAHDLEVGLLAEHRDQSSANDRVVVDHEEPQRHRGTSSRIVIGAPPAARSSRRDSGDGILRAIGLPQPPPPDRRSHPHSVVETGPPPSPTGDGAGSPPTG